MVRVWVNSPFRSGGEDRVAGIRPAELAAIGDRLEAFADDVFASLPRRDQRARGECYLRGLMLDGRRKSVEPMAARLGEVHYQALHHFVATSPWDWRPVRRRLAERLVGALGPTGPMVWAVDDTGFPKDGKHSVGVQRQYSGTLGKTGNCQLGVSVNAVTEQASCPLDWRLFVPQSWDQPAMATRRAACHLPKGVHHRPKWQLALDMLDELGGWDLHPPLLVADCGYGEVGQFRDGLDTRQIPYVVQVKADTSTYAEHVHPVAAPYAGKGRHPRPRYHHQPSSLKELVLAAVSGGQQACVDLIWRRGSKGLQRSRFAALRVRPAGVTPRRLARAAGTELPVRWLLVEWPHDQAEPVNYWLSNLPETTPIVELVRLGKLRWRIEQDYRELKGALGLDHFEGRSFGGWHHHVTLVSVAHGFLTLERQRSPNLVASA
jgi:SRSO17 transposase